MTRLHIKQINFDKYPILDLDGSRISPSKIEIIIEADVVTKAIISFDLQFLDLELSNLLVENPEVDVAKEIELLKAKIQKLHKKCDI